MKRISKLLGFSLGLFLVLPFLPLASAGVAPAELTVELDKGATAYRTIAFTNPENRAVTVTAQAIGVSDVVMILNTPQIVQANASTTFMLFIQGNKDASGLITFAYDGGFEFVTMVVKLVDNVSVPKVTGHLSVTYELYVDVGKTARLIVRDAATKEAILGADVTIDSPIAMTVTAGAGYADIPIEENGIWTGQVNAEGYRPFNFVFVAKGEVAPDVGVSSVVASPSPLTIGQAGQVTAMGADGRPVSGVTIVVNGVPYQTNPAIIVPTSSVVSVEVRDAKGKTVYGPMYLTATAKEPAPTPEPERDINLTGVAMIIVAAVLVVALIRHRGIKSPFKRP